MPLLWRQCPGVTRLGFGQSGDGNRIALGVASTVFLAGAKDVGSPRALCRGDTGNPSGNLD